MSNNQGRRNRPQQRPRPKANGNRPTPPVEQNGEPAELPDISTKGRKLSTEKVVLFRINGYDYQVPAVPTQGMVMRIIHELRTRGDLFGFDFAMEELLGAEDYERFRSVADYLNEEESAKLVRAVETHMLGMAEQSGKG